MEIQVNVLVWRVNHLPHQDWLTPRAHGAFSLNFLCFLCSLLFQLNNQQSDAIFSFPLLCFLSPLIVSGMMISVFLFLACCHEAVNVVGVVLLFLILNCSKLMIWSTNATSESWCVCWRRRGCVCVCLELQKIASVKSVKTEWNLSIPYSSILLSLSLSLATLPQKANESRWRQESREKRQRRGTHTLLHTFYCKLTRWHAIRGRPRVPLLGEFVPFFWYILSTRFSRFE